MVQENMPNMRKVIPPNIQFNYVDKPESAERLKLAYDRLFTMARQNIIQKKKLKGGRLHHHLTYTDHKSSV